VPVAIDGKAAAVVAVAGAPRETAEEAIGALEELGVPPVMLSRDGRETAERVAAELGIEEVIADALPAIRPPRSRNSSSRALVADRRGEVLLHVERVSA
jgi:Cu2+-exporting ATPase